MKAIYKTIAIVLLSGTGIGSIQTLEYHLAGLDFTAMYRLCH